MGKRQVEIILMRQLASYLAVPILIVDRNLDLLFFNESAEPIIGRRFDETGEIRRGSWNTLFHLADANGPIPREDQLLAVAIDRNEPSQSRFSLTGLDGKTREVEALAFPLTTREDGLLGAVGIFWEASGATRPLVPGRSSHSHSRHAVEVILLRRLTDRLLIPTFVVDAEGRLLFYNPAAEPLIGRRFAELGPVEMGEWYDPFRPTDVDGSPIKREDHPMAVALRQQQPSHRRFLYQGLDGVKRLVEGTAFPLAGQCHRHLGAAGFFWETGE